VPTSRKIEARVVLACALALGTGGAAASQSATREASEVELYFELKLLYRKPGLFGKTIVDQWAGGRLLAAAAPVDCSGTGASERCGVRLELLRPLEDPWTFRWYDFRDEVKLGAAIWVGEPEGDPYAALAPRLAPLARERYDRWWDDDRIADDGSPRPAWWRDAERFWARAHATEARRKDPLHAEPVYPFWVLGDPTGRVALDVSPAGAVVAASVVERMSEPWRPDGWSAWQDGRRVDGYGYWDSTPRPRWEPRTYQAFAEALGLLGWSWPDPPERDPDGGTSSTAPARHEGIEVDLDDGGLVGRAVAVVAALSPRAGERMRWRGGPVVFRATEPAPPGSTGSLAAEAGPETLPGSAGATWRAWRHARLDGSPRRPSADETWFLAGDPDGTRVRLWIRVGYRPAAGPRPSRQPARPAVRSGGPAARPDSTPFEAEPASGGPR